MMRALLTLLVCAPLVAPAERAAHAISREEDIVRDLNETFKAPSTFPPNPALRPNPDGARNGNGGERVLAPLGPDEGPGPEQTPEIVPDRTYPFLVALVHNNRSPQEGYVCAGTLIAPQWVVTAAHCTFAWTRRWPIDVEAYVLFNTSRLSQPGPKVVVKKVVPHPQYDARTLKNDIALVRIDTNGQKFGPPLKLEGPDPIKLSGEIAHVVGWGVTNRTLLQRQRVEAQQLVQVAVRGEDCFAPSNLPKLKGAGVFCASSLLRHHDIRYRFGGGPIILRDENGRRYLAGMVSWPSVCPPEVDKMNAYLNVQHFVPWIRSTIAANGGPSP